MAEERSVEQGASASEQRMVVLASSLGTVFEWYDFFVYGALAALLGSLFFPAGNETAGFLLSLATFGAGFVVRPFGALVFGALGDMVGRKYTFLVTITLMGLATAGIGFLPTFEDVGIAAAFLLLALRLLQGLAIGGEYGGAATYVAEHAPSDRRGFFTSFIQATATIGLFLSLAVVATCRGVMDEAAFREWGWRIPFVLSLILLAISIWIRMRLRESPVFKAMKEQGKGSRRPIRDSFANRANLRIVLIAFFGCCAGQAVIWYTGNFYAMLFMQNTLGVHYLDAYLIVCVALAFGMGLVVFFGWLSDRVGRKWLMLTGCLLAAFSLQPIFQTLAEAVNPALAQANRTNTVMLIADPAACAPVIFADPATACQKIRALLTRGGVQFETADAAAGGQVVINVPYDGEVHALVVDEEVSENDRRIVREALDRAGYPAAADGARIDWALAIAMVGALVLLAGMVYGPIAAFLVELFPTRIRYTSLSLPYHVANGVIGGFQPFISFAIMTATGDLFAGLWYPVAIAAATAVIGAFLLPETRGRDLHEDRHA